MAIYTSPYSFPDTTPTRKQPKEQYIVAEDNVTITTNTPYPPHQQFTPEEKALLKFTTPTPIQKYVIPALQQEHSALIRAPTGMGKTHCFLIPIIQNIRYSSAGIQACVVAPTRELCEQIKEEAQKLAVPKRLVVEAIYGTKKKRPTYRSVDLLIAAPGRLLDSLGEGSVNFGKLKYFILDEADKLLDMGFERDLRAIKKHVPSGVCVALFSATFTKSVKQMIREFLPEDRLFVEVKNETVGTIKQRILRDDNKDTVLLEILKSLKLTASWKADEKLDKVIVFVERKSTAAALETQLQEKGIPCMSLHGDKAQSERSAVFARFKADMFPVLVATSVAARGIDIKDLKMVINYEFPNDIKEYIHRIGRTGREGKSGEAVSFFSASARDELRRELVAVLRESNNEIPDFLVKTGGGRKKEFPKGDPVYTKSQVSSSVTEQMDRVSLKEKEDEEEDLIREW